MEKSKLKKFFHDLNSAFKGVENSTFADVKTQDGLILRVSDLAVDATVEEVTAEGVQSVLDGTYVLEDGMSIVVVAGIITEIMEAMVEEEPVVEVEVEIADSLFMDVTLQDGTVVNVTTQAEGVITVNDTVELEDGSYVLQTGETIVVMAGVILEIIPMETEEESTSEEAQIAEVITNMQELINEFKKLRSEFVSLKEENAKLKSNFAKEQKLDQEFKFEGTKPRKASALRSAIGM